MRGDFVVAVALLAAGLGLGTLQDQARKTGRADAATEAVRTALAGPMRGWRQAVGEWRSRAANWRAAGERDAELRRLRAMEAAMAAYEQRVAFLQSELDRLRQASSAGSYGKLPVRAPVLGFDPRSQRLTLGVSEADGVRPGMPVTTQDGLLAIVESVSPSSTQALLLTSAGRLLIELLEEGEVVPGEEVVTSGYSAAIPRGLRVGTVLEVKDDPGIGVRQAVVLPSATVGEAVLVTVLR
jgi:rod shape-determining protein MreC